MPKSKNAVRLTKTFLEKEIHLALTPKGTPREFTFDTEVPGFFARVTSGSKSFGLAYRVNGRPTKPKIGSFPAMTCEQARDIAHDWYVQVRKGIDPAASIKQVEMTVAAAWAEFDANHISRLKPKTRSRYHGLWRIHIEPEFGNKPLSAMTTESVERLASQAQERAGMFHTEKVAKGLKLRARKGLPATSEGAPKRKTEPGAATANRLLALVSKFHGHCGYRGWRLKGDNPAQGITRNTEVARLPKLTDAQVVALGRAFEKARIRTTPWAIGAIKALFFSGHRKEEVFALRWDGLHLDTDNTYADLPDSKTGPRTLPLNEVVVDIIREMETLRPGFPSDFVFQSQNPKKPIGDPRKTWEFLKAEAGIPWLRIHDFRHVFGSSAVSHGTAMEFVQRVMGHADARTTARYARFLTAPLVEASNKVSGRLAVHLDKGAAEVRSSVRK